MADVAATEFVFLDTGGFVSRVVTGVTLFGEVPLPDNPAPEITVVSPAAGTPITPTTPLTIVATDDSGLFTRVLLMVAFANTRILEVVHDGSSFGPMYRGINNARIAVAGGYRYTILRDGGWPASPSLTTFAIDQLGAENT